MVPEELISVSFEPLLRITSLNNKSFVRTKMMIVRLAYVHYLYNPILTFKTRPPTFFVLWFVFSLIHRSAAVPVLSIIPNANQK